jgi:hypothetical protein
MVLAKGENDPCEIEHSQETKFLAAPTGFSVPSIVVLRMQSLEENEFTARSRKMRVYFQSC